MTEHSKIAQPITTTLPAQVSDNTLVPELLQNDLNKLSVQKTSIQKKLSIGAVDDPLEYEADAMADQVMRMPE